MLRVFNTILCHGFSLHLVESIGTQLLCHNFEVLDCEWWRKSVGFMWK